MSTFLSQLQWRRATKKFDASNKVTDAQLDKILDAIRMTPTSFGLQPFYVKVVKDQATKEKLQAAGWGQVQFPTSTATLVFVARSNVFARIDQMLNEMTGGDATKRAAMKDFEGMMKGFAENLNDEARKNWAQKQCYIALGFGLAACAELGVASCPMEGFAPPEFDKILGLPQGDFSTVVLTVGNADPQTQMFPQFRFPKSDLFKTV